MQADALNRIATAEFVLPDYAGGSIANVPATVAALLGAPFQGLPPLQAEMWQPLQGGVRRVVLLIVDSLGWQMVDQHPAAFARLAADRPAVLAPITSIFPSTTVAALSSLWTGSAPMQHGLVGLTLLTPQYGSLTQFIHFTPAFGMHPDALVSAGLDPETFLDAPGVGEQLTAAGVPSYVFKGVELVETALSKMHGRGVTHTEGAVSAVDMLVRMRQVLEQTAGQRLFMSAYWPSVDKLMHLRGWQHPSVAAEMRALLAALQDELLDVLSPAARAGTLFCLVADHGQIQSPSEQYVLYQDHPQLEQLLLLRPAGEARVPYFYARQGGQEAVLAYLQTHLAEAMVALPVETAVASGLFGPPPHSAAVKQRLGDVVGIMRDGYAFLTPSELSYADRMRGRHGGLHPLEMRVPWLAMRLDQP